MDGVSEAFPSGDSSRPCAAGFSDVQKSHTPRAALPQDTFTGKRGARAQAPALRPRHELFPSERHLGKPCKGPETVRSAETSPEPRCRVARLQRESGPLSHRSPKAEKAAARSCARAATREGKTRNGTRPRAPAGSWRGAEGPDSTALRGPATSILGTGPRASVSSRTR